MDYQSFDCLVIGSGAAGYNAANRIQQFGKKSVAVITEDVCCGTSRNTGSDKQTYYKLGLGGSTPDSVRQMAEDLFACGSTDGDTALCEAALSARCFMNLVELDVPFPVNRCGEYVGYKTDHDPYARAASAGPLTSKYMTEALQKRADELRIDVLSGLLAVEVLTDHDRVCGLLCLETASGTFRAFRCGSIVLATGGPAGIYADSVYPECHTGSSSLALKAGASLQNMTEWQYGLASIRPRWNVSGSYMQVLPRFVSVDADGNEQEFLQDFFPDAYEALSAVFLKGYQWPFDSQKVLNGSSVIDLLVYRETVLKKRRVFLDYTRNPFGLNEIDFSKLSEEAFSYLSKAKAAFGTPIERLEMMNRPAAELYASKGVDLRKEYLEIALCVQHNNGGAAVDRWWQTSVRGLFAAGECAGTHGVTRPGGSALNAGQVGSLRAAQYISYAADGPAECDFPAVLREALARHSRFCENVLRNGDSISRLTAGAMRRMSDNGAAIRDRAGMAAALESTLDELRHIDSIAGVGDAAELGKAYKLWDILTVQAAVLTAMIDYFDRADGTRGSALYCDASGRKRSGLEEIFRMKTESGASRGLVQEVRLENGCFTASWRPVRPIPADDDFFENVWKGFRKNKNID